MIIEQTNVELLSIKLKSKQEMDNDIERNDTVNNDKSSKLFSPLKRYSILGSSTDMLNELDNEDANDDDADRDHSESSVRFLSMEKTANGICGFHLTRTKWDPYPWVSAVDKFTPAEKSGLQAGECVLEVNGCDVLGLRITEIAKIIKSSKNQVTLLLWSTKCNSSCQNESLCAAPMPRSMHRLSVIVQCVLSVIECPVCLDTITPPAMQCQNGHLLCVNCRIRAENCPVCRDRYYPRPALIAEQLQAAITNAFDLCRNEDKVRQKIFGRLNRQQQMVKTSLECLTRSGQVHKSLNVATTISLPDNDIFANATQTMAATPNNRSAKCERLHKSTDTLDVGKRIKSTTACNKLLAKLLNFKTYSMEENLHNASSNSVEIGSSSGTTLNTATSRPPGITKTSLPHATNNTNDNHEQIYEHQQREEHHHENKMSVETQRSITNHIDNNCNATNVVRQPKQLLSTTATAELTKPIVNSDLSINSNRFCCESMPSNQIEHFSLSSSDLTDNNKTTAETAGTAAIMSPTNVDCSMESVASTVTATASSLSLPSSGACDNSPVWFKKRPCQNSRENHLQSIPRALKVTSNSLNHSQLPSTNAHAKYFKSLNERSSSLSSSSMTS